jgi:DNA-binding CsgD family transcriptional regulator
MPAWTRRAAECDLRHEIVILPSILSRRLFMDVAMKLIHSLRFTEQLSHCRSTQDVGTLFADTIAPHGFPMATCGGARDTPTGLVWEFFFNTWPAEWLHEYQTNDYVRVDLVPAVARLTTTPFTWRELLRSRTETPKQVAFHKRIRELGLADGFAVPIHHPNGDMGLCVSVTTHPIEDQEERMALHLASLHAYERCRELGGETVPGTLKNNLSPREVECLKWVVGGKSDTDIGSILGISHTTVHYHIERAKKKLGVRTRAQASAVAMTLGYV